MVKTGILRFPLWGATAEACESAEPCLSRLAADVCCGRRNNGDDFIITKQHTALFAARRQTGQEVLVFMLLLT